MPKEEWGTKRVCPATGKRFYDLNKDPIVSPYTGEVVSLDTGKGKRSLVADKVDAASVKKDKEKEEEGAFEDDEIVLEDDEDDADVVLGDDVLEDDDDSDDVSLDDIADVSTEDEE